MEEPKDSDHINQNSISSTRIITHGKKGVVKTIKNLTDAANL